ncbi:DoxX family membrane protein [Pseudalkalibacillus berkeleyi]|uniref:DoxX family membrane protein n=1 Tax=Pseudalkalibacillus berkeleyi TaxID=1069813 RepID=A0ABS9H4Q7_9BACL|nr:DoxX family membrane protein [Pseudalkalibacillus berkeleyi]MCF6139066.1 DoxX family membrane protein [Pseudalkalibacillus berkeleyi]
MKLSIFNPFFSVSILLMRILFGFGWMLAGITKITDKGWFSNPGVFLKEYLLTVLGNPDVPGFYKWFIEWIALEHTITLNYLIPIAQIILGSLIIIGFLTVPSVITCLVMHINFLLSGNINLISIVLYTSGFMLIIFRANVYSFGLDHYLKGVPLRQINYPMPLMNTKIEHK